MHLFAIVTNWYTSALQAKDLVMAYPGGVSIYTLLGYG
jgi:hypothetical protein